MDYQDVLALVGASSAHPGGMKSTLYWMDQLPLEESIKVLEVGCGTGRTLTHLCKVYGCQGTGVDVRSSMIAKAKQRSDAQGVQIEWRVADATALPFENGAFDIIVTESVNVFIRDISTALGEYLRVLKPGGIYLDVEMTLMAPVDEKWKEGVKKVYGAEFVPGMKGWKQKFRDSGFKTVRIIHSQPISPMDMMSAGAEVPDLLDLSTPGSFQDPSVLEVLQANSNWMDQHFRELGFAVITAEKAPA
ncbi:class I SAM-dependent methyltransferase [Alicyclobacillus sp. SO9]|uniref:class I SAM-dependent methyltransferase n=1 Tax=Alicyclobacillus sp. SO9 TaxID=2665646 RepID=UPI0018E896EB|nr:class I SAM-dependent methyltransferase [Alicyclobacillus sp. SO9]QQE76841.1 class I SAM-dependent methyltransferase [Alicyclobacillus sp. SO9]